MDQLVLPSALGAGELSRTIPADWEADVGLYFQQTEESWYNEPTPKRIKKDTSNLDGGDTEDDEPTSKRVNKDTSNLDSEGSRYDK